VQLELDSAGRLNHAELDRDGRRIVTAHSDHTARVWDTRTGKATSLPMLHEKGVNYATFSPDSRLVATASDDETARVWDSSTGEPVTPPLRHDSLVRSVRFGPDGTHLLTTTADGRAQVWALELPNRPLRDDLLLTRLVAAHQIDDTGAYLPVRSELLESAWQDLRPKYGAAFVVTPDQVSAWEERQSATRTDGQAAARVRTLWGDGVEFMDLNEWPEAIAAFAKAVDLLHEQPLRSILATTIPDNLATTCSQMHRFQDAIRECNEALWRWPNDYWLEGYVSAYHKRAWNHVRLGEFEKAKTDFQKGFAVDPGFANYRNRGASYYHNLARAYVLGPADFRSTEKALPLARKALELGSNPIYFNTLGVVYYRLGQFERATEFLEKNAKTDDALATTWNWLCLAMSFQRLGQTNKAEGYYARATAWASQNAPSLRPLDREDLEDFRAEAEAALGRRKKQ
jgi:tetratricopeptide (TPR) repeat protein